MKKNIKTIFAAASTGLIMVGAMGIVTASAANIDVTAKLGTRFGVMAQRGNQEITRRIDALNALSARINAMERVSASEKASLSTTLQTQITAMTALQAKINGDVTASDTATLKIDVDSITKSYRIFALVLPQGYIVADADREMTIASLMTNLSAKFQARITEGQTNGENTASAQATLTDFNAKVADANIQANAAITEVASLSPDNGDQAVMTSNTAALKDANAKLKVGRQDLISAQADAKTLVSEIESYKVSASATTTVK